jgi:hypothetical protein
MINMLSINMLSIRDFHHGKCGMKRSKCHANAHSSPIGEEDGHAADGAADGLRRPPLHDISYHNIIYIFYHVKGEDRHAFFVDGLRHLPLHDISYYIISYYIIFMNTTSEKKTDTHSLLMGCGVRPSMMASAMARGNTWARIIT